MKKLPPNKKIYISHIPSAGVLIARQLELNELSAELIEKISQIRLANSPGFRYNTPKSPIRTR